MKLGLDARAKAQTGAPEVADFSKLMSSRKHAGADAFMATLARADPGLHAKLSAALEKISDALEMLKKHGLEGPVRGGHDMKAAREKSEALIKDIECKCAGRGGKGSIDVDVDVDIDIDVSTGKPIEPGPKVEVTQGRI